MEGKGTEGWTKGRNVKDEMQDARRWMPNAVRKSRRDCEMSNVGNMVIEAAGSLIRHAHAGANRRQR